MIKRTKYLLLCFSFLFVSNIYSQTVKELEEKLANDTMFKEKKSAVELLGIDQYNLTAINYMLNLFSKASQKDSIKIFWNRMMALGEPKTPTEMEITSYLDKIFKSQKDKIIHIEAKDASMNYYLGKHYYQLFIYDYYENKDNPNLETFVHRAYSYLSNAWKVNDSMKYLTKYPLIQIATYLKDYDKLKTLESYKEKMMGCFPLASILQLPSDWKTNYKIDIFSELQTTVFRSEGFNIYRKAFKEPILASYPGNSSIYRFTLLSVFCHPITIRIEKYNSKITLYWKVCKGGQNLNLVKEVIVNKHKMLSLAEWNKFIDMIHDYGFWQKTYYKEGSGLDGASWILEGKENGDYKVLYEWSPKDKTFCDLCLYLLKLTNYNLLFDGVSMLK